MLRTLCLPPFILLFVLTPIGFEVQAGSAQHISVERAWARASIGKSRPAVAYMTVKNSSRETEHLDSLESDIAERVEIHLSTMRNGIMRMKPIGRISIPPRGVLELKPGGYHVMLFGLRSALVKGQKFTLTLTFRAAGKIAVPVIIHPLGSRGPAR